MAKPGARMRLAMGVALAAATAVLAIRPGCPGAALCRGQAIKGPVSIHVVLNTAIECYRWGEYDRAAHLLQQAQQAQQDLTAAELNDLNTYVRLNSEALKSRREGAFQVRQADEALRKGQNTQAERLLRAVKTNQYLTPADKLMAQQLSLRLRAGSAPPVPTSPPANVPSTEDQRNREAQTKVREARVLLAKGDYQGANNKAYEALKLGATYTAEEDSPRQVLEDIEKAKTVAAAPKAGPKPPAKPDAKALLISARAAFQQGDLDKADRLAKEAEKAQPAPGRLSGWLQGWGDTPAKLQKDIQVERAKKKAPQIAKPTKPVPPPVPPPALVAEGKPSADKTPPAGANKETTAPLQSWRNLFAQRKAVPEAKTGPAKPADEQKSAPDAPQQPPAPVTTASLALRPVEKKADDKQSVAPDANAAARTLLKQGRKALRDGNLKLARRDAEQARDLRPDLQWFEDNPNKLLTDIRRVEDARLAKKPEGGRNSNLSQQADSKPKNPVVQAGHRVAVPDEANKPVDPRALLRQARSLFGQNKLDEAEKLGQQAAAVPHAHWGLFEDSPEKLRIDINKTRLKHDQEESVRILAEARKLYVEGDLKEAKKKAYLAQKLHGPYSFWDLGDRPQKLINEIDTDEFNKRKIKLPPLPPVAIVKASEPGGKSSREQEGTKPAAPPASDDPRAVEARELLAEARSKLDKGEVQVARALKERVEKLSAGWDTLASGPAPWGNELSVFSRELDQATLLLRKPDEVAIAPPADLRETAQPVPAAPDPGKLRAKALLAEAQTLRSRGQLVEAREKALEAQKIKAVYTPEEERPETVLLQLLGLCDKRIAALMQRAEDCVRSAGSDPNQFRRAEADLQLAKQLSGAFGLDTMRVDNKIAWMESRRGSALVQGPGRPEAAPPSVVHVAAEQSPKAGQEFTPREQGLSLLAKARLELQHGQTIAARKLAESALAGPFGVNVEAQAVLRSIDTEEFNQGILAANRTFDAALAAFNRHDYAHASRIVEAIDVAKLDRDKAARLKEIMMMPEMQPAQLAANNAKPVGTAQVSEGGDKPNLPFLNSPGKASLSDTVSDPEQQDQGTAEGGLAARVVGMEQIKFEQLSTEARQAQRDAIATFKAGDMDRALEILRNFQNELDSSNLDADKLRYLRHTIEDRLQKLQTLKVEREFERTQVAKGSRHDDKFSRQQLLEQQKQEKAAELMEQYHAFYKDGKYAEAEMTAQKALEVDPDNVAASAAYSMARTQKRLHTFRDNSKRKEELDLNMLNDTDDMGPPSVVEDKIYVDPKFAVRSKSRGNLGNGLWPQTKSAKERAIERRLASPISLKFKDAELSQVIDDLRDLSGVNVVADTAALDDAGVRLDRKVSLNVENIAMKSALNVLLQQVHLTYVIKDEVLQITTEENKAGKFKRVTYPVADLVVPVENHYAPDTPFNVTMGKPPVIPEYGVAPYTGPYSMTGGTQVSNPSTGIQTPSGTPGGNTTTPRGPNQSIEELLIKLITSTIAPQSWSDVGGQGTIQYFPLGLALIINQTPDLQEQIADLLAALRRLQDLEVAIEMRLISVSESFFERIGVDFNVNIVNNNHKFDNQLLTGAFQQPGFINNFAPSSFVSGLTPAGTLTQDLNIPLQQNSFALTTPPFGYTGLPGTDGGLSLGLAFLSDIQVFMFLEAAQGDRRVNVMQAPKLTMFNGQSATLNVQEQQYFLTGITPGFSPTGQIFFTPINQPFPLGVFLTIQPVVSADRRFVRMNLNPQMTNLTDANVPLIPLAVPAIQPVPQIFQGGVAGPGQGGLFEVFLQQPKFSLISVQTTVSVPDGGTVLLGGLKTLSEGRSEFGPPILSKIPYINRLFKNVGYGREAASLMIMVTPRIIINEEEEIRQTGGPGGEPQAP